MSVAFAELAARIRGEVADLARVVDRTLQRWSASGRLPAEQDAYLEAVALNLHGFYSGIERVFDLIARQVDGGVPTGDMWHRDLLDQVVRDNPDKRPAVISSGSMATLDELRRFRRLVRNVYTFNLDPRRMELLVESLRRDWPQVRSELVAFAELLEDIASSDDESDERPGIGDQGPGRGDYRTADD